jgi:hypothetical protein
MPDRVEFECSGCGARMTTTMRARSVKHRKCGKSTYVREDGSTRDDPGNPVKTETTVTEASRITREAQSRDFDEYDDDEEEWEDDEYDEEEEEEYEYHPTFWRSYSELIRRTREYRYRRSARMTPYSGQGSGGIRLPGQARPVASDPTGRAAPAAAPARPAPAPVRPPEPVPAARSAPARCYYGTPCRPGTWCQCLGRDIAPGRAGRQARPAGSAGGVVMGPVAEYPPRWGS